MTFLLQKCCLTTFRLVKHIGLTFKTNSRFPIVKLASTSYDHFFKAIHCRNLTKRDHEIIILSPLFMDFVLISSPEFITSLENAESKTSGLSSQVFNGVSKTAKFVSFSAAIMHLSSSRRS